MKDIVKVEGNILKIYSTINVGFGVPCPTEKLDIKMKDIRI